MFFEKGKKTENVWYFEQKLPEGVKAYNKTKPMKPEEFKTCKDWWNDREAEQYQHLAWKVPFAEIKGRNFNLDIKNPHQEDLISHDPGILLVNYAKQQQDIQKLRDQLKMILSEALAGKA